MTITGRLPECAGTKPVAALFVLLLLLATPAGADICEGNGYTLEVGDGMQVRRKDAEICSYRAGEEALVMLKDWPGLERSVIEAYLDKGYQAEDIALVRRGELREILAEGGTGYLATIDGIVGRKVVKGIGGGFLGDSGQGVAVLIASDEDKWDEFEQQANAIVESIRFTAFEPRLGERDWRRMLAGVRLSNIEVTETGEVKEDYYFCSNGRFHFSSSRASHASGDGDTMFGFSSKRDSGEWDVRTVQGRTQLVLYFAGGRENWGNIEDRNGETWVDDTRYFMLENKRCR